MVSFTLVVLVIWWVQESSAGFFRGQRRQETLNPNVGDFSIPARCLEDPDNEDCRRRLRNLQRLTIPTDTITVPNSNSAASSTSSHQQPHSYVSDYAYDTGLATTSPTKDQCYGNMKRYNKKYCNSEMPSVSIEPSEQPTLHVGGSSSGGEETLTLSPTIRPSSSPFSQPSYAPSHSTVQPSESPSQNTTSPTASPIITTTAPTPAPTVSTPFPSGSPSPTRSGLGQCEADCDTDSDCQGNLICFQRDPNQAVPGCDGMGESDDSRRDYCTGVTPPPVNAPSHSDDEDICRIQLYWDSSFHWQGSSEEMNWCMICGSPNMIPAPTCEVGDNLYIHECNDWQSTYFEFINSTQQPNGEFTTMIQVHGTNLCLERSGAGGVRLSVYLAVCNPDRSRQHWTVGELPISCDGDDYEFEISQPVEGIDLCLTTHHHPKHGEEVEVFPCTVARNDDTSLWKTTA